MKVDFFVVEEATAEGKRLGVECGACGERFFNRLSDGNPSRVIAADEMALAHATRAHQSEGGVFRPKGYARPAAASPVFGEHRHG